jgi:hypothetical protein
MFLKFVIKNILILIQFSVQFYDYNDKKNFLNLRELKEFKSKPFSTDDSLNKQFQSAVFSLLHLCIHLIYIVPHVLAFA